MKEKSIFDQQYRVVAVKTDRLLVRGILSGEVLTIMNNVPETPLTPEDYPLGKLIALTDPSTAPHELRLQSPPSWASASEASAVAPRRN